MMLRVQVWGALWRRYIQVFRDAWGHRPSNNVMRVPFELEFLPAHLELMETPVHPAPQWTGRVLMLLVATVVLIALIGRLDIVAVAPGQLMPDVHVKLIQPAVTGVVRQINVVNGQQVHVGQVLMELDPTQAQADVDQAHSDVMNAQLALNLAESLLRSQQSGQSPTVADVAGATTERQVEVQHLAAASWKEYNEKQAALQSELLKRQQEQKSTQAEIIKLERTLPLARQEADDFRTLAHQQYVSTHEYLDKQKLAIEQAQELSAQQSHALELQAGIEEQQHELDANAATFRQDQLGRIDKAQQQWHQALDDAARAGVRRQRTLLTAPVSGTVQNLTVHTVGGVVTTAQTLMEVVPEDALDVEAKVTNKDIGFINPGQRAIIKIETFPYTRYGYMVGRVIQVSTDAIQDKKMGAVFLTHITIPSNKFHVGNKMVNLTPGMQVTAEIKTGKQSVAHYFLSPLLETGEDSLRER